MAEHDENGDQVPRASTLRRVIVTACALAATLLFGFLYGLFGFYAISYWGLTVGAIWALVLGLVVFKGRLTAPEFTLPLGFALGCAAVVVGLITFHQFTESDVRADFDRWANQENPDASPDQAWVQFLNESLQTDDATGGAMDVLRYKARFGERHQTDNYTRQFVRKGFFALLCWGVLFFALPVAGLMAAMVGGFEAYRRAKPEYTRREALRRQRQERQREKERQRKAGPTESLYSGPPAPLNLRLLLTGLGNYIDFLPAIIITGVLGGPFEHPGLAIFVPFALSGLWVSAALGALEPERRENQFSWKRFGNHFVNVTALLLIAAVSVFIIFPVVLLLTVGIHEDLPAGLFIAALLFGLVRLWPLYTTRYLYRGEDDDPGLAQRGWGAEVVTAWRLTGNRGALLRGTLIALGVPLIAIVLHDYGLRALPEDGRWMVRWAGLLVLLPLAHLVLCERAIALRNAADVQRTRAVRAMSPIEETDMHDELDDRIDAAVARNANSPEEAERLRRFMDAIPRPLLQGGDALVEYAKGEQDKMVEEKGKADPREFLRFGIRLDRIAWVQRALDAGVDINRDIDFGQPPLTLSVGGSIEVMRFLLDQGADIEVRDKYGRTPLWHAAESGSIEAMELLMSRGADPGTINDRGQSAMHAAVARDRVESAQLLLDAGADVHDIDQYGQTLLHLAAGSGKKAITRWLIRQGLSPNQTVQSDSWMDGFTPLALAVRSRHLETAKALVADGADPRQPLPKGRTLLTIAADSGTLETCRWLIEELRLDPNERDGQGHNALGWAEYQDRPHRGLIEYLRKQTGKG